MIRHFLLSFFLVLSVAACSSTARAASPVGAAIRGDVSFIESGDSAFIVFRITPDKFAPDSVSVSIDARWCDMRMGREVTYGETLDPGWIIYRSSDEIHTVPDWVRVERVDGRLWISGRISVELRDCRPQDFLVNFKGFRSEGYPVYESARVRTDYLAWGFELPVAFGYFKSKLASPFDKEGVFLGLGIAMEYGRGHWRFVTSTSWSGLGGNFSFSEPFRLGARFYTGNRTNFLPQFYGALKLSKLKLRRDDLERRDLDWGGELGIAVEGPFERLGYHYSTALGGYHTVELFLSIASGQPWRAGSKIQLRLAEDVWEVRLSVNTEGWYTVDSPDMARYNDRPLPHKILSRVGALPGYVVFGLFSLL